MPLSRRGGASAVLLGAAALLCIAAVATAFLPRVRQVPAKSRSATAGLRQRAARVPALVAGTFRDGVRCVVESPLARQLAVLVAMGGAFAALVYLQLSATAAARHAGDDALTAVLSTIRSVAQVVTLLAQLVVAPWLLRRLGTGWALLLSPLWAVTGAALLGVSSGLASAALVSVVARGLDQSLETPAQKLVHTLLPPASRGRVVGVVEGVAKRGGAIVAGLLGGLLVGWPGGFSAALGVVSVCWLWSAARTAQTPQTPQAQTPAPPASESRGPPPAPARATDRDDRRDGARGPAAPRARAQAPRAAGQRSARRSPPGGPARAAGPPARCARGARWSAAATPRR